MDIDLLCSLGGCSRFPYPICMATQLNSSSSSSSILDHISTKSHHFLLFFGLVFILLAVVSSSTDPSKPYSDMASSLRSGETLFSDSSPEKVADTTVEFEPREKANRHASHKSRARDQFGVSDHEVPSGPNPISNR